VIWEPALEQPLQFIGVCGIGVQRVVEAFDPALERVREKWGLVWKRAAAAAISIALGALGSILARKGFYLDESTPLPSALGYALLNGLLVGGAAETFNSLVKMLGSAKALAERSARASVRTADPHLAAQQLPEPPTFARHAAPP